MYVSWQSSPEKVLVDAATYARTTPGAYHIMTSNGDVTAHYDGKLLAASGTYSNMQFDSIIDGQTAYLKTATPDKLVALLGTDTVPVTLRPLVGAISQLIANRWMEVSLDQLPSTDTTESTLCALDGNDQLTRNTDAVIQLIKVYMQHDFMKIKTEKSDGTQILSIAFDNDKVKGFWDAMEKTQYYESLTTSCASLLKVLRSVDVSAVTATVSVDDTSHVLKTVQLVLPNKQQVRVVAAYGHEPAVSVPANTLSYETITNMIWQSALKL